MENKQDVPFTFAEEQIVVEIASPWRRMGAVLINVIAWILLAVIAGFMVGIEAETLARLVKTGEVPSSSSAFDIKILMAFLPVVLFGIWQLVAYSRTGQTFGKWLLGIKVIRTNGDSTGFWRLVMLREVVYSVITSIFMSLVVGVVILSVGNQEDYGWTDGLSGLFTIICVVMMFVARDRRTLQDWLADTVVIKLPKK